MTILVAGGTGYLGAAVTPALLDAGHRVRVLARRGPGTLPANPNLEVVAGDLTSGEGLDAALKGCDVVINLVAIIVERGAQTFDRVNVQGSRNLVGAARRSGAIGRYIHVSALGARFDPRFRYLSSKLAGQQAVAESGLPYTVFQPGLLFGEGGGQQHFFSIVAGLVRSNPVVPIPGSGSTAFQPVASEDVARAISLSLANDEAVNRIFEVAGREVFTYEQIVDVVAAALGKTRPKVHIPLAMMRPLVSVMEAVLKNPPVTSDQLRSLAVDNVTRENALIKFFGIEPRLLADNLGYLRVAH